MQTTRTLGVIIGNGRLSGHIPKLFGFQSDCFVTLDRSQVADFFNQTAQTSNLIQSLNSYLFPKDLEIQWEQVYIYLAVKDDNIFEVFHSFVEAKDVNPDIIRFCHFSGARYFPEIVGIHPLMTFSKKKYLDDFYQGIALFCDHQDMTQEFSSRLKFIEPKNKVLYHALCVMLGNFPQLLIQEIADHLPKGFDLKDFSPLITQSVQNILEQGPEALTGPLVRKDFSTIKKHQEALKGTELGALYNQFTKIFTKEVNHV